MRKWFPFLSPTDLNVSLRAIQQNESKYKGSIVPEFEKRQKEPILSEYHDQIMAYLDEIMPIKSGTSYRLQFCSDEEL